MLLYSPKIRPGTPQRKDFLEKMIKKDQIIVGQCCFLQQLDPRTLPPAKVSRKDNKEMLFFPQKEGFYRKDDKERSVYCRIM